MKLLAKEKKVLFQARSLSLRWKSRESCHIDYLIFWGGLRGPMGQISLLVLIRKFLQMVKTTFMEEVETIIRVYIKAPFGDMA